MQRNIWYVSFDLYNLGSGALWGVLTWHVWLGQYCVGVLTASAFAFFLRLQEFVVIVNVFGCLMLAIVYIIVYIVTRDVRIL